MVTNSKGKKAQQTKNTKPEDNHPKAPNLKFRFSSNNQKILKSRGVDGMCFAGKRNAFQFDVSAVRIKPDIPGTIVKGLSVKHQVRSFSKLIEHPLRGSPMIGIGSFPSDLRAKMLAVNIMDSAISFQDSNLKNKRLNRRDYPMWHKVYGGLGDNLRDIGTSSSPSMIVLSNVDADSTAHKIEKVRDILEKFPNIPRLVVISGCDPMWFFAQKLHLPMDNGFYIGPDVGKDENSVLDI